MLAGSPQAMVAFTIATSLSVLAAASVPRLVGRTADSSRIVITSLCWNAIVIVPIYVLGFANLLYPGLLAKSVSGLSVALLGVSGAALGPRATVREIGSSILAFVRAPFRAMQFAVRGGSFGVVAVPVVIVAVAYLVAQAVLEGTWGDWDCLWYHEPILAFSIQNHGFAPVSLDPGLQKINGYPRLTEETMLWFGIFHGRWAIDLVNGLFTPLYAAAAYRIAQEVGLDKARSVSLAAVAVSLPGFVRLLPTTMVDPHAAALLLGATSFATARSLRIGDAVMLSIAVALGVGSKAVNLVPGFLFCLLTFARLLEQRQALGLGRVLVVAFVGGSFALASVASVYLRNYVLFHNPLWPDIRVDMPSLGIHWPGNFAGGSDPLLPPADLIPSGPMDQLRRVVALPHSVHEGHSWQIVDYGFGMLWFVLPMMVPAVAGLALIGVARDVVAWARRVWSRSSPVPKSDGARDVALRLAVVATVTVVVLRLPFHIGRYYLGILPIGFAVLAYLFERAGRRYVVDALVGAAFLGNLATWVWNDHRWFAPVDVMARMIETPTPERWHREEFRSAIRFDTATARERELGPGDVVTFERIGYLALLWNDHYSNRVVWLQDVPDPVGRSRKVGATWAYAGRGSWFDQHGVLPGAGFERVGILENEGFGVVLRRVRR